MRTARLFGQACFTLLLIALINTPLVNAQVSVNLPALEGSVGQTISVPVELTGVETTTGFSTFQFEVASSSAGLVFVGHDAAGTLSEDMGAFSGGPNDRVGGFTSSNLATTSSGTLIYILVRIDYVETNATLELQDFRITLGGEALTVNPFVPATEFAAGVDTDDEDTLPDAFVLQGNYPNPFNPTTNIQFDLKEASNVEVSVMDLLGRTMMTLPARSFSAGANQSIAVDALSLTSGIYIYRVVAQSATNTYVGTGTMTLLK